jgi:hypothetical protein
MKIHYYVEYYKGQYLVKSKIGNEVWGNHDTEDKAVSQITFLQELKNPNLYKKVVLETAE